MTSSRKSLSGYLFGSTDTSRNIRALCNMLHDATLQETGGRGKKPYKRAGDVLIRIRQAETKLADGCLEFALRLACSDLRRKRKVKRVQIGLPITTVVHYCIIPLRKGAVPEGPFDTYYAVREFKGLPEGLQEHLADYCEILPVQGNDTGPKAEFRTPPMGRGFLEAALRDAVPDVSQPLAAVPVTPDGKVRIVMHRATVYWLIPSPSDDDEERYRKFLKSKWDCLKEKGLITSYKRGPSEADALLAMSELYAKPGTMTEKQFGRAVSRLLSDSVRQKRAAIYHSEDLLDIALKRRSREVSVSPEERMDQGQNGASYISGWADRRVENSNMPDYILPLLDLSKLTGPEGQAFEDARRAHSYGFSYRDRTGWSLTDYLRLRYGNSKVSRKMSLFVDAMKRLKKQLMSRYEKQLADNEKAINNGQ